MLLNSKDDYKLSLKQYNVLLNYFDYEYDITDNYIMQNNYDEISKTIGKVLKQVEPRYNPHEDDWGDIQ